MLQEVFGVGFKAQPDALLVLAAGGYLILVNALAFALFGRDKRKAVTGEWRTPESTLLAVAALGGWPGAKLGQRRFRHKTRQQPFATVLNLIGVWQIVVLLALGTPLGDGMAAAVDWIAGLVHETGTVTLLAGG